MLEDFTMRLSAIGVMLTLALSLLVALHTSPAQQAARVPRIGYLQAGGLGPSASFLAALRQGLSETGYVEGQNLTIEYRWAEGNYDRLPALAADLVRREQSE